MEVASAIMATVGGVGAAIALGGIMVFARRSR